MDQSTGERIGTRAASEPVDADQLRRMYAELRRIARRERRRMPSATLNTTALIHEAWLRLYRDRDRFNSDRHFLGTAAMAMRQIVVDYARARLAEKRGGNAEHVELGDPAEPERATLEQILDVESALRDLEELDPALLRLVELRFFIGLSRDEASRVLGISSRTATREWAKARSLLRLALDDHARGASR